MIPDLAWLYQGVARVLICADKHCECHSHDPLLTEEWS
jgi:hypothetical protein